MKPTINVSMWNAVMAKRERVLALCVCVCVLWSACWSGANARAHTFPFGCKYMHEACCAMAMVFAAHSISLNPHKNLRVLMFYGVLLFQRWQLTTPMITMVAIPIKWRILTNIETRFVHLPACVPACVRLFWCCASHLCRCRFYDIVFDGIHMCAMHLKTTITFDCWFKRGRNFFCFGRISPRHFRFHPIASCARCSSYTFFFCTFVVLNAWKWHNKHLTMTMPCL